MTADALAVLAAIAIAWGGIEGQGEAPFAPAEVIVRFRNGSEPARFVAAWAKGEAASQGRLDTYLAVLADEVGIPAKAKRVASGGDVILSIDLPDLNARLVSHLKSHPRVVRAAAREPPGEVGVELAKGSREAQAVARALPKRPEGAVSAPSELVRELVRGFPFDVAGRITPEQDLLLGVDPRAATLKFVERLRQRADVEYAQPNFVLKLGLH